MVRLLVIVFIPLILVYGSVFVDVLSITDFENMNQLTFWASFVGFSLLFFWRLKATSFFATFEHELTHNFWALITFNKPTGFHVYENGEGSFEYKGRGNFMISLSPYFFPTFAFFLLPFHDLLKQQVIIYYFVLMGVVMAFHFVTSIKETHLQQSDIKQYGWFFSLTTILLGNIVCFGAVIAFTHAGWEGILQFFVSGFDLVIDLIGKFTREV